MLRSKRLADGRYLATWEHGEYRVVKSTEGLPLNPKGAKQKLLERYNFLSQGTSLHIMVLTLRCNLECVYCHASSRPMDAKGVDMDRKTAKRTVDFIMKTPSPKITIEFQGGEPLANWETLTYAVQYARKANPSKDVIFSVVTNLTLMTEERLRFLIDNKVNICTSIDGHKALHDRNRPGSHSSAERWIKRINEEYRKRGIDDTRLNALVTVTRDSLKHPKEIVDEYVRLGFQGIHLRFLNKLGYGTRKGLDYTPEEFIGFWKQAMDHIIEVNRSRHFEERLVRVILLKIFRREPNYLELRSPCGAAIGQLTYNHDGKIYSCDEGRMLGEDTFMLGTIKDSYADIIKAGCPLVLASINDSQYCDMCVYKPYCGICPVCNYAEHGSIIAPVLQTRHCRIYMAIFDYVFDKLINDKEAKRVFLSWIH
jgi:uncharacterized protein